jgi:hypothetical protein
VPADLHRARDLRILDAVDAHPRRAFDGTVWRITREGRDPLQGGRSASRWCNGEFDVLYTSLERDGALAEIYSLLNLQPVFPSKLSFRVHRVRVVAQSVLHLADLPTLAQLGVSTDNYQDRNYDQTQQVADAAYFLGFDGLVAPSARWTCLNAVLFIDRIDPGALTVESTEDDPVNWSVWRTRSKGRPGT